MTNLYRVQGGEEEGSKGAYSKQTPDIYQPAPFLNDRHFDARDLGSLSNYDVSAALHEMPRRQIPWDKDENKLAAWAEARTGFPWIDAAMTQLREEG